MSNPFELALQAKQKKIEVKELSAAAKAVYEALSEEELKRYLPKKQKVYNPYEKDSTVGGRNNFVPVRTNTFRNFRG